MKHVAILLSLVSSLALGQSLPLDTSAIGGVSLSTSQTITGAKTFSATLTGAASTWSGTITSTVGSGTKAFRSTTNGAEWDVGTGTFDYFISDGSQLIFAGPATFGGNGHTLAISSAGILDVAGKLQHKLSIGQVQAVSVADDGAGTAAVSTLTPTSAWVEYTCNDTNGCTITLSETGAVDGSTVRIVNVSANACNFADTAGVTELTGAFAMGQWDTLTLVYVVDRWVELNRSNN